MTEILGAPVGAYVGFVVVLMGFAAFMTGQAVAATWKSVWQLLPYGLLLALAGRFLLFALFDGELLALPGFLVDLALMIAVGLFAWRITYVRKVVSQYPWLYRRKGVLGYESGSTPTPAAD